MSLIAKLQDSVASTTASDTKAYVEILKVDDPSSFELMRDVAFRLEKSVPQIVADREAIARAIQIRSLVQAGRGVASRLAEVKQKIADFDAESARIAAQRQGERGSLVGVLSSLLQTQAAGRDAAAELEQLRARHPDVLADEPVIDSAVFD